MTVAQLIVALQNFAKEAPHNGAREFGIRFEDDLFFDFRAGAADGLPGQSFFTIEPNYVGPKIKVREAKLAS